MGNFFKCLKNLPRVLPLKCTLERDEVGGKVSLYRPAHFQTYTPHIGGPLLEKYLHLSGIPVNRLDFIRKDPVSGCFIVFGYPKTKVILVKH